MIAYIVSEGSFDVQLLQAVLPQPLLKDVGVFSAGGISAVKSFARSLVVRRQVPVLIVVDADSTIPELVQERLTSIEEIVTSVAVNTPVKVVLAVPEIEAIFFQDTSLLSRILGYPPPQDLLDLAVFQPKKALERLLSNSDTVHDRAEILDRLTHEEIEILRKAPFIQEIVDFLRSVRETATSKSALSF